MKIFQKTIYGIEIAKKKKKNSVYSFAIIVLYRSEYQTKHPSAWIFANVKEYMLTVCT